MAPIYEQLLTHGTAFATSFALLLSQPTPDPMAPPVASIAVDRDWDVLTEAEPRAMLRQAAAAAQPEAGAGGGGR